MIGYVGVPGALVALPYRGGLSTATDRPVSFTRTLGGKRKALVGPRARREWDVSFDLMGSREAAGLVEIARSGGEVLWYPADATSGNLLSPQAAGFEVTPASATRAGLVQLPDGTVAEAVIHSGGTQVYPGTAHGSHERVPVRHGERLAVGAWGLGGLGFSIAWWAAGSTTSATTNVPVQSFAGWQWREAHFPVPAWASFVSLGLTGGTQYARPSVSWGSVAQNRPGRGCPKALVHGLSESLSVIARDDSHGSVDVTISEVG